MGEGGVDLIWLDCCFSFQDFCGMLENHKNVGIRNNCTQSIVWWVGVVGGPGLEDQNERGFATSFEQFRGQGSACQCPKSHLHLIFTSVVRVNL